MSTQTEFDVARCCAYLQLRRDREAVETCERAAALMDFFVISAFITAAHAYVENREGGSGGRAWPR